MTCLVLRLAGPLQAWGSRSRFVRRETELAPTKSGVIGMLAAARGVRRTDDLTEFLGLRFGVRIDQPGRVLRDFQTARSLDGTRTMPLSYRQYLADAIFVAAVEGERDLLTGLDEALCRPTFPLYLGRRSCPPVPPVRLGMWEAPLHDVLTDVGDTGVEWQAAAWQRDRRSREPVIRLDILRDLEPDKTPTKPEPDEPGLIMRDVPLSFDPTRREYGWRPVLRDRVVFSNPDYRGDPQPALSDHDPFAVLGG